jgi:hypothetical protein
MSYLSDESATNANNIISNSSKPYLDSALGDYRTTLDVGKGIISYLPYGQQINLGINVGEYLIDKGLQIQTEGLNVDLSSIGNYLD